jgi:hypothetical protein
LIRAERGGFWTTALTWVSLTWHEEIEAYQAEGDNHPNAANFMEKLMALRAAIASLNSAGDWDREPDVTNGMLYMVTYALLFFVLLTYPIKFYTAWTGCVQPFGVISSFLFAMTFHGLLQMQLMLARSPYDPEGDCVNMDSLVCGMEEVVYYMIRAGYQDNNEEEDEDVKNTFEHAVKVADTILSDSDDDDPLSPTAGVPAVVMPKNMTKRFSISGKSRTATDLPRSPRPLRALPLPEDSLRDTAFATPPFFVPDDEPQPPDEISPVALLKSVPC